jgi:hypothetical protein
MTPFETWQSTIGTFLKFVRDTGSFLPAPPLLEGDAQARLNALWNVRREFAPADGLERVVAETASSWAKRLCGSEQNTKYSIVEEAFASMLHSLDLQISQCLRVGARHPEIIASADFVLPAGENWHIIPLCLSTGLPVRVVVGKLSHLPAQHPARQLLREDDYYQVDLSRPSPSVVLGYIGRTEPNGRIIPRDWYVASEVRRLTAIVRAPQVEKERDRLANEKAEAEREKMKAWNTPEAKIGRAVGEVLQKLAERRTTVLAELESAGMLTEPLRQSINAAASIAQLDAIRKRFEHQLQRLQEV